ncbi:LuxR C-terminal-related transcriptional regulator [Streptomyces sp. NPDC057486]|uniref:LuxR C-terminal-related transcriptional regulator n=1 Tax=Streptomyces sp. NPDC057486 TaxID=3346145 RepID=UPI0036770F7F
MGTGPGTLNWPLRGRTAELDRAGSALQSPETTVVSLTGLAGIGKSAVARALLRQAAGSGRPIWIPVDDYATDDEAIQAAAARLRAHHGSGPAYVGVDGVPGRRVNRVVAAIAVQFPDARIVATSERPLGLPGEIAIPVVPLSRAASIELLHDRARVHAGPGVPETADDLACDLIAARLAGHPLALHLAGLQSRTLSLPGVAAELDLSLDVLRDPDQGTAARHQSLAACIRTATDGLDEFQREVLALAIALDGGLDTATVRRIPGGDDRPRAVDAVTALVGRGLVVTAVGNQGRARIQANPLLRRMTDPPRPEPATMRAFEQDLAEGALAMSAKRGAEWSVAAAWFDDEHANLLGLFRDWASAPEAPDPWPYIDALFRYWVHRGLMATGVDLVRELGRPEEDRPEDLAVYLQTLGGLQAHLVSYTAVYDDLSRSVELWRITGDRRRLATALVRYSASAQEVDGFAEARAALEEAMAIYDELGDLWSRARTQALLGAAAAGVPGQTDFARDCLESASTTLRRLGDTGAASLPLQQLGRILLDEGDYEQAETVLDHGYDEAVRVGDLVQTSAYLNLLAWGDESNGHPARAASRYLESLKIAVRLGLRARAVWCLDGLADAVESLNPGLAELAATEAAALRDELGLMNWIEFCCPKRHPSAARPLAPQSTRIARLGGQTWPPSLVVNQTQRLLANLADSGARAMVQQANADEKGRPDGLTPREMEILGLIAQGNTSRDIANRLVISIDTVGRHITNMYRKIGARGRADATSYALRHGIGTTS